MIPCRERVPVIGRLLDRNVYPTQADQTIGLRRVLIEQIGLRSLEDADTAS
jgi:hypothetical protein